MASYSLFERDCHSSNRRRFWPVAPCGVLLLVALALSLGCLSMTCGETTQDTKSGVSTRAEPSRPRVKSLEIVVLSTMLTDRAGVGEWGFSALVVADGHRILFDTGARPETVLRNARELKIDLSGVNEGIVSHHHGDHTGGLVT